MGRLLLLFTLPFKGRAGVGMGSIAHPETDDDRRSGAERSATTQALPLKG
jgi:hypothetical protein